MVQQSVTMLQEFGTKPLPKTKKQKLKLLRLNKKQKLLLRLLQKQQTLRLKPSRKLMQKQIREQKRKQPKLTKKLLIKRRKNRNKYKLVKVLIALEKPSLSSQSEKRKLLRKALSMAKQTRKPLWDMLSLRLPLSPSS